MIKVYCFKCKEFYDEKTVKFMDISEGPQGEDLMTFKCKKCKTVQVSRRLGGY